MAKQIEFDLAEEAKKDPELEKIYREFYQGFKKLLAVLAEKDASIYVDYIRSIKPEDIVNSFTPEQLDARNK